MTSLEEIKNLYYKAIKDAKLDDAAKGYSGTPGYSTEDFSRWARQVDIFTLGQGAADFALEHHEEIVREFGEYRRDLAVRLSQEFLYDGVPLPGYLRDIGSCWDGSKVGAVNEMDSLFVMHGDKFVCQENTNKRGLYHVCMRSDSTLHEITPRNIRDQFADKYSQLVSELKLPECLKHGGNKSCDSQGTTPDSVNVYRGVRYNGPAATSQFLARDKSLLTWDMTPVIVLPLATELQDALRQSMKAVISDNPDKMFPPGDVHLIPDVTENLWRLSTAQLEADVLRVLSKEGPFKKALSFCKVLSSRLKNWKASARRATTSTVTVDFVNELLEILETGTGKTTEEIEKLNRKMRFGHIWIPQEKREEYNEDQKSDISINNAAVKHILFKAACKRNGAFGSERNMDLVRELILEVFETLANEEVYSSEHAFLPGALISHFSVSPSMAHKKHALVRDICQQCRTLVQEAMTEPTYTNEIDLLVDEMNQCISKWKDLRCGEYCFKLKINPWQHPTFDKNIHHLLTLVTSLRSGCGGVIYFLVDDEHTVTREAFDFYKERLSALAGKKLESSPSSITLVQISLLLGTQKTWAALLLKKSYAIPRYPTALVEEIWKPINFVIDIHGLIRSKAISETQSQETEGIQIPLEGPSQVTTSTTLLPMHYNEDAAPQDAAGETSSASGVLQVPNIKSTDLFGSIPVDFSSCRMLAWSENKKGWENYVKMKDVKTDDIVGSCPMWKPEHPMKITPDKGSLMYLFKSEEDMEETLFAVTTKCPGCAVVCRTWRYHVSGVSETETRPPGHICDILTITETGRISFLGGGRQPR